MAGNLLKCTYVQKTKMLLVHRNNFLNGLHASNLIFQYKIIPHSYLIKLHDGNKTDLCPEKNYLNESVTIRIQIYYQLYCYRDRNQHFMRYSLSDLGHTKTDRMHKILHEPEMSVMTCY